MNAEATTTTQKRARAHFGGRGWLVIIVCILCGFMSTSGTGSVNISSTYFVATYGWSMTLIMLPISLGSVLGLLIMFFGGKLIINRSPRRVILVCSICFAVCYLFNGASRNLPWFYITILGCSIFGYFCGFICCPTLIANWFPRKTGLAMGWVTMGIPLGAGLNQFIMRPIYTNTGRLLPAYIPIACIAIVVGILAMTCFKDFPAECGCYPDNEKDFDMDAVKKEEEAVQAMREKSPWTFKRIFTTKEFWFIWISIGMISFCAGFQSQTVTTLMTYGMKMSVASYAMLGVCLIACAGSWFIGKIDARFGTKVAMILACCMCFAMAIFAQFPYLTCKVIAFVFVGICMGGSSNFLLASITKCWGPLGCMTVFRYAQPFLSLCTGFSTTVIAWIAGLFGGNYNNAFIVLGVMGVISLILIIFIRPANVQKKEQKFLAEAGEGSAQAGQ